MEKGSIENRCGCIVIKEDNFISVAIKLKNEDILSIPSFSFFYRFEIYKFPTYPLIRLYLEISSKPEKNPLKGEILFDVDKDRKILNLLSNQPLLHIHFFNEENSYISSKEIPFFPSQRDILTEVINEALNFLSSLSNLDLKQALEDFYSSFPII